MKKQFCRLVLAAIPGLLALPALAQNRDASRAAGSIRAVELREKLTIIAGAEMEGRETATEGQRKAAAYIESRFAALGLVPGNGNSYQQSYPVYSERFNGLNFSLYGIPFAPGNHVFSDARSSGNGLYQTSEIIYAGFEFDKDTSILRQVKGKWVLLAGGKRENATRAGDFAETREASTFPQRLLRAGAAGLVVVNRNFPMKLNMPVNGNMYLRPRTTTTQSAPQLTVSYQTAASILSRPLSNFGDLTTLPAGTYKTQIRYQPDKEVLTLSSSNVLGILPGTDKKDEYLFITAHYDHLGRRDSVIYFGADDDGSGTVSVLEMAEAFTEAARRGKGPRRSIVFMTVSGEEKGLWGSEYYTSNPTLPLDKVTADLNIDMVGRIDPSYKGDPRNYVFTIGEDKLSSDLQGISDEVNKAYGLNMELDRRYNDVNDRNRFYYRSDHYNFAKNGVPVIFYFNGVHPDYHRPTDSVEKIEFDLMAKRVKLVFYTAWEMANRENMLKRDKPLNIPPR